MVNSVKSNEIALMDPSPLHVNVKMDNKKWNSCKMQIQQLVQQMRLMIMSARKSMHWIFIVAEIKSITQELSKKNIAEEKKVEYLISVLERIYRFTFSTIYA